MSQIGQIERETKVFEKPKRPKKYAVFVLNDDYTPIQFVVSILQKVFKMNQADAWKTAYDAQKNGSAICGIYPFEIAETKIHIAMNAARKAGHPLMFKLKEVEK